MGEPSRERECEYERSGPTAHLPPPATPHVPEEGRRAGPEIITVTVGDLFLPLTRSSRNTPESTAVPTLLVEVWVIQPQNCELPIDGLSHYLSVIQWCGLGRDVPSSCLFPAICARQVRFLIPPHPLPAVAFIQENRPCSSPGQHSRADLDGLGVGKQTLRA